jgi:hypothetical protein
MFLQFVYYCVPASIQTSPRHSRVYVEGVLYRECVLNLECVIKVECVPDIPAET